MVILVGRTMGVWCRSSLRQQHLTKVSFPHLPSGKTPHFLFNLYYGYVSFYPHQKIKSLTTSITIFVFLVNASISESMWTAIRIPFLAIQYIGSLWPLVVRNIFTLWKKRISRPMSTSQFLDFCCFSTMIFRVLQSASTRPMTRKTFTWHRNCIIILFSIFPLLCYPYPNT